MILLAPALHAAEKAAGPGGGEKKKSAFEDVTKLLPPGSELKGVILPSYDENRLLSGTVKAKVMRLVDAETMSGETIHIDFFNGDRTKSGRAELAEALFHSDRGMIESWSAVSIDSDSMHARGSGLVLDLEKSEGVLLGPLQTWAPSKNQQTAMNSKSKSLRAAGLAGVALVSQAVAEPAAPPSADAAKKDMAAALEQSNAANAKAKAFLENAGLAATDVKAPEAPAAKPLDIKPGPDDTVVNCDGGMYFNPDEGVFVYMKNVRVTDPRFNMSGANELKIFLEKASPEELQKKLEKRQQERAEKAKAAGKEVPPEQKGKVEDLDFRDKFGDPEKIVATGAILVEQKPKDEKEADGSGKSKDPIKASGAVFMYDMNKKLAVISGGYPWVTQGGLAFRAKEPDLSLRIYPEASRFETEGNWENILPLKQLQEENEKRKKEKEAQGKPNR